MRKFVGLMLAVGVIASVGLGYEGTIGFQVGHGAKALGMGGAFSALANDGTAALWNPAGLAYTTQGWLSGATTNLFGLAGYQYLAGGFSYAGYGLAGGWASLTAAPMYSASLFLGSVGVTIADIGSVGVNVKYYSETLEEDSASGFGFDIGLLFPVADLFTIGIVATDVGGVSLWDQTVTSTYRAGVSAGLLEGALTLAADVDMVGFDFATADIRAGLEFQVIESLAIRAGLVVPAAEFDALYFTVGAGVSLAGLTVDAAYLLSPNPGESLVLSAGFNFGELFAPPAEKVAPVPPTEYTE